MASKYKRHSTGGRFKQRSASDLGSGAIKAQADVVVNSLKLQQARSSEYASDYVQGMKGVEKTEEWNSNLLSKLEDDVYQNKRDAIKVRQKREVENLQGKAKEYGKQAEFWKDFSTTYSKQWGKLAQGSLDLHDRLQADKQLTEFYASENWQQLTDTENPALRLAIDAITSKENGVEAQKTIIGMVSKLNRFARVDVLSEMKKQIPDLIKNLESELSKQNIKWNEDTIGGHVQTLSNEIQRKYGLANTREGRAFDRQMSLQAGIAIKTSRNLSKSSKETKEWESSIKNVYSVLKNADELYLDQGPLSLKELEKRKKELIDITLLKAYKLTHYAWRTDSNGKVIEGLGPVSVKAVVQAMADKYSFHDPSFDGIREMIGKIPDPDNPKQNLDQRYKGNVGQNNLDNWAYEISNKRSKEEGKKKDDLKKAKIRNKTIEFIRIISEEDVNTKETGEKLRRLEHETTGLPEVNDLVNAALAFRYNERNLNSLYESLNRSIQNGDLKHMESIIGYLPEPQKTFYQEALDKAERIDEIFPATKLTAMSSPIDSQVKENNLQYGEGELGQMKDLYKTTIRNHARDFIDKNPTANNTQVETYATQMAQDALKSGAGIWRIVRNPSGKGKYAAFLEDEVNWVKGTDKNNPKYAGLTIEKVSEKVAKHGLEGFLNLPEHGETWNAMSLDVIDDYLIAVARGENITTNETLEILYRSQLKPGYTGRFYTRTEILNKLASNATSKRTEVYSAPGLQGTVGQTKVTTKQPRTQIKKSEFDTQDEYIIPLGPVDKADFYVNSSKVNIPNYHQYSVSDQTALGALFWSIGEDGKLPKSQQLEDIYSKSAELGIPPMELVDGIPNIINYPNYFTRPRSRFTVTTERPE
tara:strand:- start:176 stop:2788 length:2613 start_codon:yes stop_codon:yes gene_type:complete